MKTTDFSAVRIRCSSIGQIMTEPQGKSPRQKWEDACQRLEEEEKKYAALEERLQNMASGKKIADKIVKLKDEVALLSKQKDTELLSETCKSYLAKVYAEVKYGKRSLQQQKGNKYTEKGKLVEEDAIDLYCSVVKEYFKKNDIRLNNEWLTGELDLYAGEEIYRAQKVIDIKSPWDVETYFGNLGKPLNPEYFFQLQGYFSLTGASEGEVAYCLVSAPESIINDEKFRLFRQLGVATMEAPEFIKAEAELLNNMIFDDMPAEHRVMRFPVQRDDALIDKIHQKVEKCREYLVDLEKLHLAPYEIPQLLNMEA
jgi:hypothetical protein